MIKIAKGNLLDANVEALVNPVNTVGVMGKGIALQFKEAFPYNYKIYRDACKSGSFHTGELLAVKDHNKILGEKLIINFPTKQHWKHPSQYEYIESGTQELAHYIEQNRIKSIAIPPLGCGNGALDWNRVKPIIEKNLSGLDAEILLYEPNAEVKELLQKQAPTFKAKLTPARAMLLYALFHYEALGEYSSLFSANKLAYFLQRMGEQLRLEFKPYLFGPYCEDVKRVLYTLNGIYLNGLEQNQAKAFEPLKLNYGKFDEVKQYVNTELSSDQVLRLNNLISFINGFESDLSLEILASVAYLLDESPDLSINETIKKVHDWNIRKSRLFKDNYIEIAYNHIKRDNHKIGLSK